MTRTSRLGRAVLLSYGTAMTSYQRPARHHRFSCAEGYRFEQWQDRDIVIGSHWRDDSIQRDSTLCHCCWSSAFRPARSSGTGAAAVRGRQKRIALGATETSVASRTETARFQWVPSRPPERAGGDSGFSPHGKPFQAHDRQGQGQIRRCAVPNHPESPEGTCRLPPRNPAIANGAGTNICAGIWIYQTRGFHCLRRARASTWREIPSRMRPLAILRLNAPTDVIGKLAGVTRMHCSLIVRCSADTR